MTVPAPSTPSLDEIATLDEYMEAFSGTLADKIQEEYHPLHRPGTDAINPHLGSLLKKLYPAQEHFVSALVKVLDAQKSVFGVAEMGTGKGGLPTTKVLTPTGWTTLGEINPGDLVIDPEGGSTKVTNVFRRGRMMMYHVVFTDGSSTVCSGDHVWRVNSPVRKHRGHPPKDLALSEIMERGLAHANGNLQHFIPMIEPAEFTRLDQPIHPYLLGVLIGNGGLGSGTPIFTTSDDDTLQRVRDTLPESVEVHPKSGSTIDYSLVGPGGPNPLTVALRSLGLMPGLAEDKFIPSCYKYAPVSERIQLLQGLFDTDGSPVDGYAVEYSTVSGRLAVDVVDLVRSLGGVATVSERFPAYTHNGELRVGQLAYRIYVSLPRSIRPFLCARKASLYNPGTKYPPTRAIAKVQEYGEDECICIRVESPNQLYVTDDFIVTHNTPMALGIAHAHARGKPYRGIAMVPDHLQSKWARHVESWVPDAEVVRFDGWEDWVKLADRWQSVPRKDRKRPDHPTWYIIGRDASKFDPAWCPKHLERTDIVEDFGVKRKVKAIACPECGHIARDSEKRPIDLTRISGSKRTCKNRLKVWDPERKEEVEGPICGAPLWGFLGTADHRLKERYRWALTLRKEREDAWAKKGSGDEKAARVLECDVRFAAATKDLTPEHRRFLAEAYRHGKSIFWRWAPARTIQKRLRGFFDYAIIDELHEEKSSTSAQANAAGKIAASARRVIGLTGTLIGGYASHVFPITYRLCPSSMVEEGFEWGQELAFSEAYGRVDEVIITQGKESVVSNANSMGSKVTTKRKKYIRPGIMPTLFGRHLLHNTAFLGLEEVSEALPPRPLDEVIPIGMAADVALAYAMIEAQIRDTIAPMLAMGDTSLLAKMLQTLLAYADHPWGWDDDNYLVPFGIYPTPEFTKDAVYPKERALIDECLAERDRGRKVWVYAQMTGRRDVMDRLVNLMKREGLKASTMRSDVDRVDREEWIIRNAPGLDVMISHPKLVETGLDLFYHDDDTGIGHNFPTIAWYETGYNLFTLRQASRRAWRIGQTEECRCLYFYYTGTMQERAMELIGKKLAAAEALDGKFSSEGLAALAGDDSLELQLARSLSGKIRGAAREWSRLAGGRVWTPRPRPEPKAPEMPPPPELAAPVWSLREAIDTSPARRRKAANGQLAFDW